MIGSICEEITQNAFMNQINWFIEQIWLKRICSQTGPTHEQNIEMDSVNQIDWFIDQIRLKLMFH